MMQDFQNCLYINEKDVTNATIYDYRFIAKKYSDNGMTIYNIIPPGIRGHQWVLLASATGSVSEEAEFPEDLAPKGIVRAPCGICSD